MNLRLLLKRGFAKAGTEGVPFHSANEARKRLSKSRAKTIRLEGVFKARRLLFITPLALLPDVQQNRGNKFRVYTLFSYLKINLILLLLLLFSFILPSFQAIRSKILVLGFSTREKDRVICIVVCERGREKERVFRGEDNRERNCYQSTTLFLGKTRWTLLKSLLNIWAFYENIKKFFSFKLDIKYSSIIFLLFQTRSAKYRRRPWSFTVDLKTKIYKKLRAERKRSQMNLFEKRERERK